MKPGGPRRAMRAGAAVPSPKTVTMGGRGASMSQRPSAPAGPDGARWPGEPGRGERPGENRLSEEQPAGARWPGEPGTGEPGRGERPREGRPVEERPGEQSDGEWPDDLWPDDDEPPGRADDSAGGGGPGSPPAAWALPRGRPGAGPRKRARPVTLVIITLAAAAIGAGIVLVVDDLSSSSAPAAASGHQPSRLAPGQHVGNGPPGALPSGGPGGTANLFMIGKVTAVTSTSITIGGPGPSINAADTGAVRTTGTLSTIG